MEMKFYRVLKADPLGEPWTPKAEGAKPLQTFWCQFEGVDKDVSMSKQVPNTPSLTYGQFGYLVDAVSQKGTEYYKFKSVKAPEELEQPRYAASDAQEATATKPAAVHPSDQKDTPLWFAPYAIRINQIWEQVKPGELPATDTTPMPQATVFEAAKEESEEIRESIGGGTITKDELEDIFGGKMADPVDLEDK